MEEQDRISSGGEVHAADQLKVKSVDSGGIAIAKHVEVEEICSGGVVICETVSGPTYMSSNGILICQNNDSVNYTPNKNAYIFKTIKECKNHLQTKLLNESRTARRKQLRQRIQKMKDLMQKVEIEV